MTARTCILAAFAELVAVALSFTSAGTMPGPVSSERDTVPRFEKYLANMRQIVFSAERIDPQRYVTLHSHISASSIPTPFQKIGTVQHLDGVLGISREHVEFFGETGYVGGGLLEEPVKDLLVWTAAIRSRGAWGLRVYFADAVLPTSAKIFVYSLEGEVRGPYGADDLDAGKLWANTIFADEVFVEIQFTRSAEFRIKIDAIAVLEYQRAATSAVAPAVSPAATQCLVDVSCVSSSEFAPAAMETASASTALLAFIKGSSVGVCTGALINDTDPNGFIPYVLTANHCIDTQTVASTVEAIWDYRSQTCGGQPPHPSILPRSTGATLLAGRASSDFAFLRMNQGVPLGPLGRWYLGWDAVDFSRFGGMSLYRVSHAEALSQSYARHAISSIPTPGTCSGSPQGDFIYSKDQFGAISQGSSGGPTYYKGQDGDLFIVGQLESLCGQNPSNNCDRFGNSTVDGALVSSYAYIQPWLNPTAAPGCVSSATTLCLNKSRFRVTASYLTSNGQGGQAQAVPLTADTGYFWFFGSQNVEVVVKVIDGCSIFSRFWVFAAGLTNVSVTMTVTDTKTGAFRTYQNLQGTPFQPIQDTAAFATCP